MPGGYAAERHRLSVSSVERPFSLAELDQADFPAMFDVPPQKLSLDEFSRLPPRRQSKRYLGHVRALHVSTLEEDRVCGQVMGLGTDADMPFVPPESLAPQLPHQERGRHKGLGALDHLLLPGHSVDLCTALAEVFVNDPRDTSGESNGTTAGLACKLGHEYEARVFSSRAVVAHLELARGLWEGGPRGNVERLHLREGGRLVIVGDTHGQLTDVLWIFLKHGLPSERNAYLFCGNMVNKGGYGLEILILLLAFKRDCPASMHLLRGNHEDEQLCIQFGFRSELAHKFCDYGDVLQMCTQLVFPMLPIAALVSDIQGRKQLCAVHGGVPAHAALPKDHPRTSQSEPISLVDDLAIIDRRRRTLQRLAPGDLDGHIMFGLLWACPCDSAVPSILGGFMRAIGAESSGTGCFYENDTLSFCKANGLSLLVRSRDVPQTLYGAMVSHQKCCTVFSASNFMGNGGNRGGVLLCDGESLGVELSEHWAPSWQFIAQHLPKSLCADMTVRGHLVGGWELRFSQKSTTDSNPLDALVVEAPPACMLQQYLMERIVEHKEELYEAFTRADTKRVGSLERSVWQRVLIEGLAPACGKSLSPELVASLAMRWGLGESVVYARFLHRFQLRCEHVESNSVNAPGPVVDLLREVSAVRRKLVDFSAVDIDHLLDLNRDREVTYDELIIFLPRFGLRVPDLQVALLYERMSTLVQQSPLTLDSIILCLAIISQDLPPSGSGADVAHQVGRVIVQKGSTYAGVFRFWDKDHNGFLSMEELKRGLIDLGSITTEEIDDFLDHMCSQTSDERRVSMFEFVRLLAPLDLSKRLQRSMVSEVLVRIWIGRPMLRALLVECDPFHRREVTQDQFCKCVHEVSRRQASARDRPQLTENEVQSVREIAAAGDRNVAYEDFLHGLHVVDVGTGKQSM